MTQSFNDKHFANFSCLFDASAVLFIHKDFIKAVYSEACSVMAIIWKITSVSALAFL